MARISRCITATSMRISRVYVGDELWVGADITLDKAASHYLKQVLRLKSGAVMVLFNGIDGRAQPEPSASSPDREKTRPLAGAISASEQCGRALVPEIKFYPSLETALEACANKRRVLLDFDGPVFHSLLQSEPSNGITILLGPEGGLSDAEINSARKTGFAAASLGPRVLRTETAAVVALAIVQATIGDLR